MNEFEVAKLPNGIEGFIAELKPVKCVKWNFDKQIYESDNSEKRLEEYKAHCELLKESLREVYSFGATVTKGTPKFCLHLKRIFDNLCYVEDSSVDFLKGYYEGLQYKPSFSSQGTKEGFTKLIEQLGLSSTTAYRYKDLANFVDEKTVDYFPEFQGYSLSLLYEIWEFAVSNGQTYRLKELINYIPSDTTVDEMRLYRKVYRLLSWGNGVFDDWSYQKRRNLEEKPVKQVLEKYNELVQKEEAKKLEDTMSGVQTVAKEDKSVKVLPAADEMIVKKFDYENLKEWAKRAENIGKCAGCKHNGTNLNKCRCCRRYESLKDLFEAN